MIIANSALSSHIQRALMEQLLSTACQAMIYNHHRKIVLIVKGILLTSTVRKIWWAVKRIFILTTGPNFSLVGGKPCDSHLIPVNHSILAVIVSTTKVSIVIGSPSAYLSRNTCMIKWVSNYRCPVWTFCNWIPMWFSRQLRRLVFKT